MKKPWYSFLYIKTTVGKVFWGTMMLLLTLALLLFFWNLEDERMQAQTENWDARSIEKGAEIFANNCYSCHGPSGEGMAGRAPALNSKYFFTQRLDDLGFTGSQHNFIASTVASGRPSNAETQWSEIMPTWGSQFGGPLRPDQVDAVSNFIMNWEQTALLQTPKEDPWIPFENAVTTGISGTVTSAPTGPVDGVVRPPDELFVAMTCSACHNLALPQTDSVKGPVGPNLGNIADIAVLEAPDMTPEEYVHQSIVDPAAHIAEGYVNGIMPGDFAERMSEDEINGLVTWLLEQSKPAE